MPVVLSDRDSQKIEAELRRHRVGIAALADDAYRAQWLQMVDRLIAKIGQRVPSASYMHMRPDIEQRLRDILAAHDSGELSAGAVVECLRHETSDNTLSKDDIDAATAEAIALRPLIDR